MSVKIMTDVWALDLHASQKIVLLALADAANDEGQCWPGMASLSKKCSKSERTVQSMLGELEQAGHITRDQIPGRGCYYTIHPRTDPSPPAKSAPRRICTPQNLRRPPQNLRRTPAKSAPKPSENHQEPFKNTQDACAGLISDDWQPADLPAGSKGREVVDAFPAGELAAQVEHFRAHHRTKGTECADWQDAWAAWVLNGRRMTAGRSRKSASPAHVGSQPIEPASERAARLERAAEGRARQDRFEEAMSRIANGAADQAEIDALPDGWKQVGETRSLLRRHPNGTYTPRGRAACL